MTGYYMDFTENCCDSYVVFRGYSFFYRQINVSLGIGSRFGPGITLGCFRPLIIGS